MVEVVWVCVVVPGRLRNTREEVEESSDQEGGGAWADGQSIDQLCRLGKGREVDETPLLLPVQLGVPKVDKGSLALAVHSRSLSDDSGCDTWFARASMRSLSDLLVLPGMRSLIFARQPPPPPPLLLLLSLLPPGCHPPFAMPRSPDMVSCVNCRKSSLRQVSSTPSLTIASMPRLRQPSASLTCLQYCNIQLACLSNILYRIQRSNQSCRMQFVSRGYL
ncbi:hypothetical protein KCU61_g375, partial [Aureobasidium melanogenum]